MAKEREAIRLRAISPLHLTNKQTAIVKVAVLDSVRRAQLSRTIVLKERASKRLFWLQPQVLRPPGGNTMFQ